MAKIDYDKLEILYETEGREGAIRYLDELGIKAPRAALKKMRDRQMGKNNDEENNTIEASFMSIDELCGKDTKTTHVHEMELEYIGQFPEINGDKLMIELLLNKIQEYSRFFSIDRSHGIVHIDKNRLLKAGFEIFMY